MTETKKHVLSASRRTDIPAFYLDWFFKKLDRGFFEITNPYNRVTQKVIVKPAAVHTIVFWSKNFYKFLKEKSGQKLKDQGYNLYFNFTLNSEHPILEPKVPALAHRLLQLEELCRIFGPENISWRFDPICFFKTSPKQQTDNSNLTHFSFIAQKAAELGIKKCVTSFFDPYKKIERRIEKWSRRENKHIQFVDPDIEKKTRLLSKMAENLSTLGIELYLCCEKECFDTLPPGSGIHRNACIDGKFFEKSIGKPCITSRDYGQRAKKGCQCTKSIDIGSYELHPCFHDCLFCYARPHMDTA